jgi:hypothetical protein
MLQIKVNQKVWNFGFISGFFTLSLIDFKTKSQIYNVIIGVRRVFFQGGQNFSRGGQEFTFCPQNNTKDTVSPNKV